MIFINLFLVFLKIGMFSFGGGYAMIPLIEKEIETHGWLTASEFIDIIAIAEMTPGPIAVNSATFVGYKTAGFFGGLAATAGVALPSLILILIISQFFFRFQKHPLNAAIFYGIRPVIVGLITTAAVFVSETALFREELAAGFFGNLMREPLRTVNAGSIAILAMSLLAIVKFRLHPILAIIGSGIAGVVIFSILPY